jgi:hypothetical protein
MATAQKVWGERLQGQLSADERARLLTWLGLAARASGDVQTTYRAWDDAESASPGSYYSYRARDLKTGASLRLSRAVISAPDNRLGEDDWRSIVNWARSWAQVPLTATTTLTPTAPAQPRPRFPSCARSSAGKTSLPRCRGRGGAWGISP